MARPSSITREADHEHSDSRLLSVREAAAILNVHEHTLRGWVRKGIIRAVHLPGSNYSRFRPEEVQRVRKLMEESGGDPGVRIERPRTSLEDLELAHRLHDEVMAFLAEQPPEETLEEVMTRLRGRPWY